MNDDISPESAAYLAELRQAPTMPPPSGVRHDLRSELEALAYGWRSMADSDKCSPFAASALRGCAEEVESALSRHAPTDPAPPPSSQRPTLVEHP